MGHWDADLEFWTWYVKKKAEKGEAVPESKLKNIRKLKKAHVLDPFYDSESSDGSEVSHVFKKIITVPLGPARAPNSRPVPNPQRRGLRLAVSRKEKEDQTLLEAAQKGNEEANGKKDQQERKKASKPANISAVFPSIPHAANRKYMQEETA